MNNLSELSKPVAWTDERGNLCTTRNKERGLESRYHQDYEKYTTPFYSQEYVSSLDKVAQFWIGESAGWKKRAEDAEKRIAELEGQLQSGFTPEALAQEERAENAEQRVAELEAKLASPVRLPDTRQSVSGDRYQWSDGVFNYKQDAIALLREQGFIIEGGE
ncbi:hypothetical protein [Serratia ureilytica]|uniref:hypothetical protein n=1 Tax=Serratia ureilytica TaxID=300181 RepID=UPI0018E6FE9C|nr:hypothetical protein [Serratia ureilytica]MBJ2078252.1 hypothetical protein [Serratia ureilytica]